MYQLAIVEDDPNIVKSFRTHFDHSEKFSVVFETNEVERLVKFSKTNANIDVIILDLNLPFLNGIDGLPKIRKAFPNAKIVIHTIVMDNDRIFQAISRGAIGYLVKGISFDDIEEKLINCIEEGGSPLSASIARRIIGYFQNPGKSQKENEKLTDIETKLIRFLIDGLTYNQIASNMNITIHGVRYHIMNIYKKLEVNTRHQIVSIYKGN
ncbi:MAG: response regulator transcription factor [Saprospiraceae bacterium]|jgi:DNA-binding NarL/FixJ family response regulator|nr:response regulator transcription factor [Saprospiraceae bacterium]